jgi:cytochrome c553
MWRVGYSNGHHVVGRGCCVGKRRSWLPCGLALVVGAGIACGARPAAAADTAYGAYLAGECAACHSGERVNPALPPLQRLTFDRLVAALESYRNGTRPNATMQAVARSLGDREIKALAAFFSGGSPTN